jgi:hypothetical protein
MKMLTREMFLSGRPIVETKTVNVGGHAMLVRGITLGEAKRLRAEFDGKEAEAAEFIVRRCLVDDSGAPLFTEGDTLDLFGSGAIGAIVDAAIGVSGVAVTPSL